MTKEIIRVVQENIGDVCGGCIYSEDGSLRCHAPASSTCTDFYEDDIVHYIFMHKEGGDS